MCHLPHSLPNVCMLFQVGQTSLYTFPHAFKFMYFMDSPNCRFQGVKCATYYMFLKLQRFLTANSWLACILAKRYELIFVVASANNYKRMLTQIKHRAPKTIQRKVAWRPRLRRRPRRLQPSTARPDRFSLYTVLFVQTRVFLYLHYLLWICKVGR